MLSATQSFANLFTVRDPSVHHHPLSPSYGMLMWDPASWTNLLIGNMANHVWAGRILCLPTFMWSKLGLQLTPLLSNCSCWSLKSSRWLSYDSSVFPHVFFGNERDNPLWLLFYNWFIYFRLIKQLNCLFRLSFRPCIAQSWVWPRPVDFPAAAATVMQSWLFS